MSRNLRKEAERRVGHRIAGKYHLREVLGVGGMGVVYAAWHEFTERLVALKLLHGAIAATHTHALRFLQEATASGAIRHPGIAEVLDAGREDDGTLYVAFELLEGEDLGAAILGGRAPPRRMIKVSAEVLDALSAAHAEGFIHRDIKPANIFLLSTHQLGIWVKLLDFGIARRIRPSGSTDGLTQAGAVVGTPYYMSPEQMCGEAVDGRADLWAVAVVLFYGLTGELPFQGRSYVSLLTEMLRKGPPSVPSQPDIPAGVEAVIKRALAPRIEDRFQSADDMKVALTSILPRAEGAEPTVRLIPEPTMALRGSTTGEGSSVRPSTAKSPPTVMDAPWERALEDIESEIVAIERRGPSSSRPIRPRVARRRSWFGRKS